MKRILIAIFFAFAISSCGKRETEKPKPETPVSSPDPKFDHSTAMKSLAEDIIRTSYNLADACQPAFIAYGSDLETLNKARRYSESYAIRVRNLSGEPESLKESKLLLVEMQVQLETMIESFGDKSNPDKLSDIGSLKLSKAFNNLYENYKRFKLLTP